MIEKTEKQIKAKEVKAARSKQWRKDNPEKVKSSNAKYRRENLEKGKLARAKYLAKLKKNKERIIDYLIKRYEGIPCIDCNRVFSWECMDFDHRPEEVKEFTIGVYGCYKATPKNIAFIEKEITKCNLICSNCHRTITKERKRSSHG